MYKKLFAAAVFLMVVSLIAILAIATKDQSDPCANPQSDISGAVLADDPDDQDALINRAIILKGRCKE